MFFPFVLLVVAWFAGHPSQQPKCEPPRLKIQPVGPPKDVSPFPTKPPPKR